MDDVRRVEMTVARVTQAWGGTVPGGNVGDVAHAIGVDAAGNVFVTGYSGCGHKTVKYTAAGVELWENCDTNYSALAGLAGANLSLEQVIADARKEGR